MGEVEVQGGPPSEGNSGEGNPGGGGSGNVVGDGGSGSQGNNQGGRWDNWSQKGADPKGLESR